ncbi:beta-3-deoxy-D-manno-oct-2-ulosonic acid transferase [Novosphingobium resinovorum]|uniref:capsular polysaccharide export protein, LipB/KpsS family n=1 Tax=Novosphingobium resinovorum TaxID=158500 RepID=UPI002ED37EC1|nr:beta-3-deoxy-D-manno-oct-2-ulosonic acid transferase [Novosphingobium resinovorum]
MGAAPLSPGPVLRAPPFPWADATVSQPSADAAAPADPAALFALVREARVGGRFWAAPAALEGPAGTVVRPAAAAEIAALVGEGAGEARWIAPPLRCHWRRDVDPWSVLPGARELVAHGDDEWVVLARVAGVPVRVLSPGRFGVPGDDGAALDRRAAQALAAANWRDPFTGEPSTLEAVVELLGLWRTTLDANRPIAAACGMAWWKRKEIRRFLWHPERRLAIVPWPQRALRIAGKAGGGVAIWPSRVSPALIAGAAAKGVPLVRVEDGFVRSVGLGVDLVPPSSVVVDASGIHFDPSGPSDLETALNGTQTAPRLLERARILRQRIVAAGISKYAAGTAHPAPERMPGRRLVLVPGQVEDDMSVLAGGGGLTSNLELLRRARQLEPEAEIWFRPHPDVDAGHRKGAVPDAQVLGHADRIVRGGGMAALLDVVDAVHVLTSLTGFEALMRGREVTCHGTPFYAGWGLTRDLGAVPTRRTRRLTLDALVAGVLILYPRYLDPVTGLPCPPEVLVGRMAEAGSGATNRLRWIAPLRRWQGRLMAMLR